MIHAQEHNTFKSTPDKLDNMNYIFLNYVLLYRLNCLTCMLFDSDTNKHAKLQIPAAVRLYAFNNHRMAGRKLNKSGMDVVP